MICNNVSISGFKSVSLFLLTFTKDGCKISELKRNYKKCSVCMDAQYCSASCQKANWKSHRLTCKRPNIEDASMIQCTCFSNFL